MSVSSGKIARLCVSSPLKAGAAHECDREQGNYLRNALRLENGAAVLVFNGRDGEWLAELRIEGRRKCHLIAREKVREQQSGPPMHYLFAPLKKARLDYMAQKAVEMGAASIRPVFTRRTNVSRVNERRLAANMIEAAEQCGVLRLAELRSSVRLEALLAQWPGDTPLVFCDEAAAVSSPLEALSALPRGASWPCLSALRAASTRKSATCSKAGPLSCPYRLARASCAPTRRRWRPWLCSTPFFMTGAEGRAQRRPLMMKYASR
jgi:16S rRNA (uracil1498-N3)-methyltransferase